MSVEAFIITNGRSTFEYALKSLENQTPKLKVTVLRDMKWVDALNECLSICSSDFYIRVDDDMFLHPSCVEYMLKKAKKRKTLGVYICRLWEDWSRRPGGYVKLYKTRVARKIRFRVNRLGKVDKPFFKDLRRTNYKGIKDKSLVGLHACGNREDEAHYRKLWLTQNATTHYDEPKELDRARKRYKKTIAQQYDLLKILKKKNKKYKTKFYGYTK